MAQKSTKKTRPTKKRASRKTAAKSFGIESDSPVNDDIVIIKRYGNRRLYNTETGTYVTYQDLIAIIRTGHDIQVIDSTTQADVTKAVLMQAMRIC